MSGLVGPLPGSGERIMNEMPVLALKVSQSGGRDRHTGDNYNVGR